MTRAAYLPEDVVVVESPDNPNHWSVLNAAREVVATIGPCEQEVAVCVGRTYAIGLRHGRQSAERRDTLQ